MKLVSFVNILLTGKEWYTNLDSNEVKVLLTGKGRYTNLDSNQVKVYQMQFLCFSKQLHQLHALLL
jgi:hypothetical protein